MRLPSIGLLLAFTGTPLPVQQGDLVIRTTTSLVEVRVVAEDKDGKPVANLDRSDFEILDNGEKQAIRLFAAYRGARPAQKTSIARGAPQDDSPTPAEYALIVLDWMNTGYAHRVIARDQLLKVIRDYEPRQRVAIYVLSAVNSGLICDFTYDRELLYARVAAMSLDGEDRHGPIGDGVFLSGPGGVRPDGSEPRNADAIFEAASRQLMESTVQFEKLADHMVRVPGRKTFIWMTEGVPLVVGGSYFAPFIESALHRMNKADTAIYSVDLGGIRYVGQPSNSLFEFARRTGGEAFVMNNDFTDGIRRALDDMQVSYTLGFHMPDGAKPGSHELKVRVTRPDLKLRYRESYDPAGTAH